MIDIVPLINMFLLVSIMVFLWSIANRIDLLLPGRQLSLVEDIEKIRKDQVVTAEQLERIRSRVQETVAALEEFELRRKSKQPTNDIPAG